MIFVLCGSLSVWSVLSSLPRPIMFRPRAAFLFSISSFPSLNFEASHICINSDRGVGQVNRRMLYHGLALHFADGLRILGYRRRRARLDYLLVTQTHALRTTHSSFQQRPSTSPPQIDSSLPPDPISPPCPETRGPARQCRASRSVRHTCKAAVTVEGRSIWAKAGGSTDPLFLRSGSCYSHPSSTSRKCTATCHSSG